MDAPWQLKHRRNISRIEFLRTFIAWVAGVYASADVLGDGAGDRNRQHEELRLSADRDPSSARRLLWSGVSWGKKVIATVAYFSPTVYYWKQYGDIPPTKEVCSYIFLASIRNRTSTDLSSNTFAILTWLEQADLLNSYRRVAMNYRLAKWLVLISLFFAGLSTVDAKECRATGSVLNSLNNVGALSFPSQLWRRRGNILTEYKLDLYLNLRDCAISERSPRTRVKPCSRTKQVFSTRSGNGCRRKTLTRHLKCAVPQRWSWTVFQLLKLASPRVWCVNMLTKTLGYAQCLNWWIHLQHMLCSGTERTRKPEESGSWLQSIRLKLSIADLNA